MVRRSKKRQRNIVDCYGFSSNVIHSKNKHITILDVEMEYKDILRSKNELDDIIDYVKSSFTFYIIMKSSKHGVHVINPVARPKDEVFQIKAVTPFDDNNHNAIGYKRDSWVARFSKKGFKHAPRPIKCSLDVENISKHELPIEISYPHLKFFQGIYKSLTSVVNYFIGQIKLEDNDKIKLIGNKLKVDKYATYERHKNG